VNNLIRNFVHFLPPIPLENYRGSSKAMETQVAPRPPHLAPETGVDLNRGNNMVEKAKIVKDAVMTAAVIAVTVGFLAFLAGGL
jgi:hypothetical protein